MDAPAPDEAPAWRVHVGLLAYALGALGRRLPRTLALAGALASAVALLAAVLFLTGAMRAEVDRARAFTPDLVVQRLVGGRPALITPGQGAFIAELPGVARVRPRVWGYVFLVALQANVTVVATGNAGPLAPAALAAGRALAPGERGACVLGTTLADALGVRAGDTVTFPGPGDTPLRLHVVGTLASPVDLFASDLALVDDEDARTLLAMPPDDVTDLAVDVTNPDESPVLAGKIGDRLPGSRVLEKRLLERVQTLSYGRRAGLVLGASLPALLALLALAWDRASGLGPGERREIAVLKSSGWASSDVIVAKLYEALLVGLGSAAFGLVLGYAWVFFAGAPGLREVITGWNTLYPRTRLTPAVDAAQIAGLLALVTAPYLALSVGPAWRAASLDPLEAMREG